MKPVVNITINARRSDALRVRGVATVDGIQVPFTVYRSMMSITILEWEHKLIVRTKRGIIREFSYADYIRNKLRDSAKGWWIDQKFGDHKWQTHSAKY